METSPSPEWGSDFFGGLNDFPAEPVAFIGQVLDAMAALAAFRDARQWVLGNLGVPSGGAILEAGCGNAAAHAGLHAVVGASRADCGHRPHPRIHRNGQKPQPAAGAGESRL